MWTYGRCPEPESNRCRACSGGRGGIRTRGKAMPKADALMETLGRINNKYSKGALKVASQGLEKAWVMRRGFKSPNYTAEWGSCARGVSRERIGAYWLEY